MKNKYPVLASEIERREIRLSLIADSLGISVGRLCTKLRGDASFTWHEVSAIHKRFFPELSIDELFLSENTAKSPLIDQSMGAA